MSGLQVALTAIWAALHTTQYGLAISGLNGIQDAVTCSTKGLSNDESWLTPCIKMSSTEFGIVVAIFTLGGLIGSLSANSLTQRLGRINVLRISALLVMLGSGAVGFANSLTTMITGRIFVGLGSGLATVTVPLYLAEIAPQSIKKSLGIMNQLFIVIGILIGQSLSFPFAKAMEWRWVSAVAVGIGGIQLVGSFIVPQTKNKDEESEPLLGETVRAMSIKELFLTPDTSIRRAFLLVLVTQISQQTCGISPVMYFSTRILQPVLGGGNSRLVALGIVIVKIPLTIAPAFLIERIGSRPLLLFPTLVMTVAAIGLGLGLNLSIPVLSAISIVVFVASFSMGLGPITWVVLSEVMPKEARTASGSVGLAVNWSTNFIMGALFMPLQHALSHGQDSKEGNIFFLFGGLCLASFLFIRAVYSLLDTAGSQA